MFEKLCAYCEREWKIVKDAPLACFVLFSIACFVLFFIMSWHYDGRLDSLREQIKTYEVKLEVTSPNQAIEKVEALNKRLDDANKKLNSFGQDTSLLKPICIEKNDDLSPETAKQILINNEFTNKVNDGVFTGYCLDKFPQPPAFLMTPPRDESFLDEMEKMLKPIIEKQNAQ